MDPKKKDIKLFGSVFSMAADGLAAYAQLIWDDVKKMFITDSRWINLPDEYKNAVYELATKEGDPNITFSDKFDSLQTAISAIPKFAIKVVDELPSSDISSTTVYLKKTSETETGNLYTEYIYINNKWEQLGTLKLDLSDYAKTSEVNTELDKKVDKETGKGLSTNDYTNDEKTKLSGIAEGAEVNVLSDWQLTIETADDYIKNKPDLFSLNIYKTDDIPASGGDDVARVILGGDWRMPTYEEYMELINNCQYEWTLINGVSGAKLIGSNNNYIFIPADCEFWCSSLEPRSILLAYTSYLTSSEKAWSSRARIYGEHIRPVSETEGIDLGLSVKWSDRNLGAVSIELVGDAYAWGETEIKTNYSWENYKFGSYDNLTKYNSTDGLTVLDLGSPAQEGEEFLAKTYYNSDGKLTKIVPKEGDVIIPKYIEEYKNEIYTLAIEFDENLIPFSGPPFLVHNMTKNMSNAVIPYGYITSLNGPNNTKYLSLCWLSAAGPSTYLYFLPKSYIEAKGLSLTPNKWYTSYDNTAKEVECIGKGLEWIHTNYAELYNPDNYEEIAENIRKAINGITEQLTFEEKFEKVNTKINTKLDKLIEGNNISIEDNEISAIIPDIPTLPEEYQNEPYIFGFTYDLLPNNTAPAIVYNYSKDMLILNTPYAYILRSGSSEGYYLQLCWYDGTSYTYLYYLTLEFIQYIGASLTSNKWYNSTSSSAQEVECLGKNLEWIHTSYLESANPDNYEEVAKNLIAAVNGKNENVTIKEKFDSLSTVATSGDYDDLENLPDLFSLDYIINYKVDDAATAAWGPDWRMPTVEECKELVNSCKFTLIIIDGVNGYKVESKKEGNTNWIFLPAAGYRDGSDVSDAGDNGYYWSSSLYSYLSIAYVLFFNNDEIKGNNGVDRYRGGSVRAVSETKGIDLGLTSGIKWADRNIGSETITGYGNYFAWGEIETKTDYSWETYKYGTSSNITKYNKTDGLTILERTKEVLAQVYYNEKGKVSKIIDEEGVETIPEDTKQEVLTAGEGIEISEDNVISTTPLDHLVHYGCDDAARYLLGSDWKTPTKANFEELVANCTATWENVWGNWGCRFTSTTNDASIFLPVTGYYIGANNTSSTTTGWYWTNEKVNDSDASCLIFGDVYISTEGRTGKCFGMPIRPVSLSQGVDLGLPSGIKWASSNLTLKGLAEREDIKGDYFAWAEYDTKSDYNTYSYKWYIAETETYTKYNTVDGLSTLTLESYIDESTKHQEFAKKSDLASVAFSGDYEDLINKYSIKVLTQSEYNSIVKDNNTLYFIKS